MSKTQPEYESFTISFDVSKIKAAFNNPDDVQECIDRVTAALEESASDIVEETIDEYKEELEDEKGDEE